MVFPTVVLMAALVAVASAAIFAIKFVKPAAAREYDVLFAVMGIIYAVCIGWEGWRLIPVLSLAQFLVVVTGGFFAVETFRLRLQLADKNRQLQGKSAKPQPFNRTYKPRGEAADPSRRVTSRRVDGRMRDAAEGNPSIESREERRRTGSATRPQLTADLPPRRSTRSAAPVDDYDENGYADDYEDSPPPDQRRSRRIPATDEPSPRRRPPRLPDDEIGSAPRTRRIIEVAPIEDEDYFEDDV